MSNLAFKNDPALAEMVRNQVAAHTAADEVIQGEYWQNGKGCFIGCIAHGDSVTTVEDLTGFPVMLTRIAENIFEGLPNDVAKGFPQRVIEAPRLGADLSLVSWKFLHWLIDYVLRKHGDDPVRAACAPALQIVADKAAGKEVEPAAARAASDAASDAARAASDAASDAARAASDAASDAAYAASDAARAAYAAYGAYGAYGASDAAAYAAYAASDAASDAAARERQAEKLIEMLAAA